MLAPFDRERIMDTASTPMSNTMIARMMPSCHNELHSLAPILPLMQDCTKPKTISMPSMTHDDNSDAADGKYYFPTKVMLFLPKCVT